MRQIISCLGLEATYDAHVEPKRRRLALPKWRMRPGKREEGDCPVPAPETDLSSAANEISRDNKSGIAGQSKLSTVPIQRGQIGLQTALRPLTKCITKKITATINSR
jgi:hypothetical protein